MRYLPLALVFATSISLAQPSRMDSLKSVLEKKDLSDVSRIETLSELGWEASGVKISEGVNYFYDALNLAEKINDKHWQALTLSDLGRVLSNGGQYDRSASLFLRAIELFEQQNDSSGITKASIGLGGTFAMIKNFPSAIKYFNHALDYAGEDVESKGVLYSNLGAAYFEKGDYDDALKNFNRSREFYEAVNDLRGIAQLYNNLGVLYQKRGDFIQAIRYNRMSEKIAIEMNDQYQVAMNTVNYADFYLERKKYDSAIYFGLKALALAESIDFPAAAYEANRILSSASEARGNFKNAYDYRVRYQTIKDSLISENEQAVVQQIHESYQLGKKENEIAALRIEQEKDRLYVVLAVVVAVSLIVILAVTAFSYRRKRRLAAELDVQNKEIQRLNQSLEIKALRSQMDPHFVFNALNGLQHFLSLNRPAESIEYLGRVAKLIRLTLQNASRDWVRLSEELEILRLYLQVEQYRFPDKFKFEFIVDPSIEHEKIPFMAIQPYVENAVLHGLVPRKENGGLLTIRATKIGDVLKLVVEDNGVGRTGERKHTDPMFTSMGSGLVKERLKKLSLQMKMVMDVAIEDLKDENGSALGTRSTLTFGLA